MAGPAVAVIINSDNGSHGAFVRTSAAPVCLIAISCVRADALMDPLGSHEVYWFFFSSINPAGYARRYAGRQQQDRCGMHGSRNEWAGIIILSKNRGPASSSTLKHQDGTDVSLQWEDSVTISGMHTKG